MDFLIVLQEQIEEENLPYANVIYTLLLLSAGTQKPLIHYKKRKSLLALYFVFHSIHSPIFILKLICGRFGINKGYSKSVAQWVRTLVDTLRKSLEERQFSEKSTKDWHKSVRERKVKMKENCMMLQTILSLCLTTQNGVLLFISMPCPHFCSTLKAKLHNVSTPTTHTTHVLSLVASFISLCPG